MAAPIPLNPDLTPEERRHAAALHRRQALGEPLSEAERSLVERFYAAMDAEEAARLQTGREGQEQTHEQRLAALERRADALGEAVAELRAAVAEIRRDRREHGRPADAVSGHTSPDWLDGAAGLFQGSETFEEAVRAGEAWRRGDAPEARTGPGEE